MGVIDALPIDGSSISAKELAQKLEADEALIGWWYLEVNDKILNLTRCSSLDARMYTNVLQRARSRVLCAYCKLENVP